MNSLELDPFGSIYNPTPHLFTFKSGLLVVFLNVSGVLQCLNFDAEIWLMMLRKGILWKVCLSSPKGSICSDTNWSVNWLEERSPTQILLTTDAVIRVLMARVGKFPISQFCFVSFQMLTIRGRFIHFLTLCGQRAIGNVAHSTVFYWRRFRNWWWFSWPRSW